MVIMEPCSRLRVILEQLITDIIAGARPSHKEQFKRLMGETLPGLEKRAYDLAEKCRASGGCEKISCKICNLDEIKTIFEKTYVNLEKMQNRYEEIKKGDPHIMK